VAFAVGLVVGILIIVLRAAAPSHPPEMAKAEPEEAKWTEFRNTKSNFTGRLKDQFVGFTFRYPPDRFVVAPPDVNFVSLRRFRPGDPKATLPTESFDIVPVSATRAQASGPPQEVSYSDRLVETSKLAAIQFQQYRSLEEKECTIDGVKARMLLFQGSLPRPDKPSIPILGKIIVVRKPDAKYGLVMILSVDPTVEGIASADDVGVKADLGKIMATFHFSDSDG
jgi:hypothetical protein